MARGIRTTITVSENSKLVRMGLQNLDAEIPKIGRRQIYEQAELIIKRMQSYPEKRPRQKYVRTFLFRRSWELERIDTGYRISNAATQKGITYPKFVVGSILGGGQAWMHAGRWQTFKEVTEAGVGALPAKVEEQIRIAGRKTNVEVL